MRITFILPHAGLAGGIRIVAIYADRLARRGHDVTVISTPWVPPGRKGKAWAAVRRWLHRFNPRKTGPLDPSHFHNIKNVRHIRIPAARPL
ncbi:MAG TPA: hypothetical protein VG711_05385, partial [Phycisphaerales bacterium]|nr:hypothetical protein [Phycisphaerales bacterium]